MCYEESFFQRWAKRRSQLRAEPKPVVERTAPATQPARPAPMPAEAKKRKEVERERETV
jgi:hypothetical protein